jgi:hypothetical protein
MYKYRATNMHVVSPTALKPFFVVWTTTYMLLYMWIENMLTKATYHYTNVQIGHLKYIYVKRKQSKLSL